MRNEGDTIIACACMGPQNGDEFCPCTMKYMRDLGSYFVKCTICGGSILYDGLDPIGEEVCRTCDKTIHEYEESGKL